MPRAVGQNRLQPIEVRTYNIQSLIRNDPRKILPHPSPHHARLAMIDLESLFEQNRRSPQCESLRALIEFLIAGEGKVIRIPRVFRARRLGQSAQTAIHSIRAKIRQRRRSRCALRQMPPCIQRPRLRPRHRIEPLPQRLPHPPRRRVGADSAQPVSNGIRVTRRTKQRLHPRPGERREEIPQIHAQHNHPSHVRRGKCLDRPATHKSMRRRMRRDLLQ